MISGLWGCQDRERTRIDGSATMISLMRMSLMSDLEFSLSSSL